MSESYMEYTDNVPTGDRTIIIKITRADMQRAKLTDFDHALFNDIQNGEPSNTPMADQLLGLETLVRRIEESRSL
jgi:hypothetical protein